LEQVYQLLKLLSTFLFKTQEGNNPQGFWYKSWIWKQY